MKHRPWFKAIAAVALGAAAAHGALAAPIAISTPFMNLENRNINSLGFGTGTLLRVGANSVVPNGANGTTGVGTTTLLTTGQVISRTLNPDFAPATPNFFSRYFTDSAAIRGPWTLTFTNGSDTASTVVSLPAGAQQAPFINSVTLSGTSTNPTFGWTPPPGATVNGYRVNIYDKSLISATNSGNVASRNLQPSTTTYTVTGADFLDPNYAFTQGKNYSIEISLIQTKNGSSSNLSNSNLQAIARSYADFTPNAGGGPPVNLPVVLANGSFQFNMSVVAGQLYYIDPEVAIGYDYEIGAGNPNFTSVDLPDAIGDGLYDIFGFDANNNQVLLAHDWRGSDVYNFGATGVGRFRVAGIETGAGLNPGSTTAFITGLTFSGNGLFTGTQTPITTTVNATPEPPTLALVACVLIGMVGMRRKRQAAATMTG